MSRKRAVRRSRRNRTQNKPKSQNQIKPISSGGLTMPSSYFPSKISGSLDKEILEKFRAIARLSKNGESVEGKLDDLLNGIFIDFLSNRIPDDEAKRRRLDFRSKFWGLIRRYNSAKIDEKVEIEKRFLENWNYMVRPLHGD